MSLNYFLSIVLLSIATLSYSQLANDWSASFGGDSGGDDYVYTIHAMPDSSILVASRFTGQMDADPGPGVVNVISNFSSGTALIQKIDDNGDLGWARIFDDSLGTVTFNTITADSLGNIYCSGRYGFTVDFDPGPGSAINTAITSELFVLKLNSNGDFIWVKTFESTANNTDNAGVAKIIEKNNNIYLYGVVDDSVDFDPGPGGEFAQFQ